MVWPKEGVLRPAAWDGALLWGASPASFVLWHYALTSTPEEVAEGFAYNHCGCTQFNPIGYFRLAIAGLLLLELSCLGSSLRATHCLSVS